MRNLTLHIGFDQDTESPCGWDDQWQMVDFNHRHRDSRDPSEFLCQSDDGTYYPSIGLRRKLAVGTAFVLSCYEHGGIAYSLQGEGWQCPWDTTDLAGLLLWEAPPSHLGPRDLAGRAKDAREFLNTYNHWLNGNCFYFSLEDDSTGELVDGCGGFIGAEGLLDAIKDVLRPDDAISTVTGDARETVDVWDLPMAPAPDEEDEAEEFAAIAA